MGQFEQTFDYLSSTVVWNIVGGNTFNGKSVVQENCEQTLEYFTSVETDFKTDEVLEAENKVIVIGTAEFKRDGKQVNFISACDIYEFNAENEIEKIVSYCIPTGESYREKGFSR